MLLKAEAILHMPPMVRVIALAARVLARAHACFINHRYLFMGKGLLKLTTDAANFGYAHTLGMHAHSGPDLRHPGNVVFRAQGNASR
jgi:hypothetical protein